jgi:hypothetical protein
MHVKTQVKSGSSYLVMALAMLRRTRRPEAAAEGIKGGKETREETYLASVLENN